MTLLTTILAFIVAISILVTIHELGHYAAARWFGVKILRFSIGFGKPLWVRRFGPDQTEWVIAALPLGGFVRMADSRDDALAPEDRARGFSAQPMMARIVIILAGPIANFLLAMILYWALFMVGTPGARPFVATPIPNTTAADAELRERDLIESINGKTVRTWADARLLLLDFASAQKPVTLDVVRLSGSRNSVALDTSSLQAKDFDGDFLAKLGLAPYRPPIDPVVARVVAGGAAERAGVRAGDRILRVDGESITRWEQVVTRVVAKPSQPMQFSLRRAAGDASADRLELTVTPDAITQGNRTIGRIGVEPKIDRALYEELSTNVRYGPVESTQRAILKVWETSVFSLKMMWRMVTGNVSWKNLSGPITIADYAGQSASLGFIPFLTFLALISVSLGVLNLLPIPLLDGGQLMYHMAEWIKGSPVSDRAMEIGQQVGLMLLLCLTAFAFYNDIQRLVSG